MLVLSRKVGESVRVADNIELFIIAIDGQRVRIGIKAPKEVRIVRSELAEEIAKSNQSAAVEVKAEAGSSLLSEAARSVTKPV
ncbi:MAG: carbon storage regulator [Verrucomicrobia bacterium Tous-C9LFEB]|nr:MAG: carbon storage regulator [Verrucomicrobia bacterium Tous-C9LFEB]